LYDVRKNNNFEITTGVWVTTILCEFRVSGMPA
jgi:hypothetical protein